MSGAGAPNLAVDATGLRVAIIAGSWHEEIMSSLVAGAQQSLTGAGAQHTLFRVAGAFELPLAAQVALTPVSAGGGGFDAAVCLGVIIRGGTPHFDYVCTAATEGLNRVALDTGTPVGFGLLTCDTDEQALDRAGLPESREDKGYEAATAALATAELLRTL